MLRMIPIAVLLLAGCGGQASPPPSGKMECSPGTSESCACQTGPHGVRSCTAGGAWGICSGCASPASCVEDGKLAPTGSACCGGELDAFGKCCEGDACCNAGNHSGAQGSSCVCNAGYLAPATFSAQDRRCLPAPDLEVSAFSLTYYLPGSYDSNMWLCLNRHPDGTNRADGSSIDVSNNGTANSGAFGVALGIQYISSGKFFYGTPVLVDAQGTAAAGDSQWLGPVCVGFSVANLPKGAYRLAVMADVDHAVAESDETNNITTGSDTFLIN